MRRRVLVAVVAALAVCGPAFAGGEPDGNMRVWVDANYLMWWLAPQPSPQPLLTAGPASAAAAGGSGVVGSPSTTTVVGGNPFNTGFYNGFRINGGWINCEQTFGVEGSYFQLAQHSLNLPVGSGSFGSQVLARPFIDAATGAETVSFVSAPGAFSGSMVFSSTTNLFGADGNLLLPVVRCGCCDGPMKYVNLLGGFRYLNLADDLNIGQDTTLLQAGGSFFGGLRVPPGSTLAIIDNFRTRNQYYGGQIGVQAGFNWWRFNLGGAAKVALGGTSEQAVINGSTNVTNPLGFNRTLPGGLLAQASNSGTFYRDKVAVLPEGDVWLNFEITPQFKLMVGYTFIYLSDVARPGQLIDRNINRAGLATSSTYNSTIAASPGQPAFHWNGTDFYAQGVNFGFAFRF